jgi:hypothetical protein
MNKIITPVKAKKGCNGCDLSHLDGIACGTIVRGLDLVPCGEGYIYKVVQDES